jgi:formin 2
MVFQHDLRRASYRVFNVRSYYMRANNKVINLSMPLPDMMTAVLAMDESVVDVDQIEKLIKFCPTNEEMELLKTYTGDKAALGKYEQYLLELMKVPRLEAKLRVFSFKTQFGTKVRRFCYLILWRKTFWFYQRLCNCIFLVLLLLCR